MQLGLHIANFTFTGGPATLGRDVAGIARHAESVGFERITVMDHLWQIGPVGPVDDPMLEAYTALGYIAASTERVLLHTLVTGVVYREPGLLAKAVSTLDVLSGGRAGLGIGAAWNEDESLGLGLPFPPTAERFERLQEAIEICLQMWSGSDEPYRGTHYQLDRTLNSPPNLSTPRPSLMIGGSGERKTLRLVARYADACNIFPGADVERKLEVLRQHCETEGRDYDTIEKTSLVSFDSATGAAGMLEQLRRQHELGFTASYVMIPGPEPRQAIDAIGSEVVPEIAGW